MTILAPVTHILPLTILRRARLLSGRGSVLVRVGQKVSAVDIVAEGPPRQKHLLLDVPAALGISKSRFSNDLIARKVGEKLAEGDVIAETKKMFNRVLRAPAAGEILMVSAGVILFEVQEPPVQLKAGFSATVVEVIPDRGVILEATGGLIQGIWGNKKIDVGLIKMLTEQPGDEFESGSLDMSMRGLVGVAGHCRNKAALLSAAELPLRGLVLGSMSVELVETAMQIELPIILLEGFGKIAMNQAAFKILYTNEKREICLNAMQLDHFSGERPELVIPLPATASFPPETDEYKFGQTVRVLSTPYLSLMGTLEEVKYEPVPLANGLRSKVAIVRLENNETVSVPVTNLEVIE